MQNSEVSLQQETALQNIESAYKLNRLITIVGVACTGMVAEVASKLGEINGVISRDVLPEPFDVPDHVGNFSEGGLYSAFFFSVLDALAQRRAEGEDRAAATKKAALGAFGLSAFVQFTAEKYGIGGVNTGDMLDAAYGTAYSGLVLALAAKRYNSVRETTFRRIDSVLEPEHESHTNIVKQDTENPNSQPPKPTARRVDPARRAKRQQQKTSRNKNRRKK